MATNQEDMEIHGTNAANQTLAVSIQSWLSTLPDYSLSRCIYRVPKLLRQVNEQAYTPLVVSIGPYHHKDNNLLDMELDKLKYLQFFLRESKMNGDLQSYLQLVKDKETEIRQCYANPTTHLSRDEFIQMILIDSIFIIELFRINSNTPLQREDDHIFGPPNLMNHVARDIRLAENQLPFFIVKDLYWSAFKPDGNAIPYLTDIACEFLRVNRSRIPIDAHTKEAKCCHLLDMLRTQYLPSKWSSSKCNIVIDEGNIICPSAVSLHASGIEFKVNKSDSCSLLDIKFDKDKGTLTIPSLIIDDSIEGLFRNMIAFEQCQHPNDTYIADYQSFLDCLINTSRDVELLVKAEIINNWLGSEKDVSDMWNTLGKQVTIWPQFYYYAGIIEQLNSYYNKPWNSFRATIKEKYFRHPWAGFSVLYAAVFLLLRVVEVAKEVSS